MQQLKNNPAGQYSPPSIENSQKARKTLILQRQRILFSAYRTDQYSDPESYMASLGMVFEDYPNDVICFVTDPKTGIQRRSKWPPTISEIVQACDEHVSYLKRNERYKNWGRNEPLMLDAPQEAKPSLEELKAKYGENYGLEPAGPKKVQEFKAPSWDEITAM